MKTIQPGSQMDKLVKLFVAKRAIVALAPWGGGINSDVVLQNIHEELDRRFLQKATECDLTEVQALLACAEIVDVQAVA